MNEQNKEVSLKFVTFLTTPKDNECKKKQFLAIANNGFDLLKCIGARKHFCETKVYERSAAR